MNGTIEQTDSGGAATLATTAMPIRLSPWTAASRRIADYAELSKLRISVLVLLVTAAGYCLGSESAVDTARLVHVLLGTALVAIGANTLNQYIERDLDRLMRRTMDRPIPSGRLGPAEALVFGLIAAAVGLAWLALQVNAVSSLIAAATLILYVCVYTPLKRLTVWNTVIGAIPGALPPVIGYSGAAGGVDALAWMLFAIVFVWQMPHFYAIAWIYREDYARGGYRMLSVRDPRGLRTARQTILYCGALIGVSLLPALSGLAQVGYAGGAVLLGFGLLAVAVRMALLKSLSSARAMLLASVIYLPAIMLLLLLLNRPA